jgi:hypothetical protein
MNAHPHRLHVVSTGPFPDHSEDHSAGNEGTRVWRGGLLIALLVSLALWVCIILSLIKLFGFFA